MYIIDGNNLAGKLGLLASRDISKEVTRLLDQYFKDKASRVIAVFDGYSGGRETSRIRTEYATDMASWRESADEKIISIIRRAKKGESFIVVTDDRGLQAAALEEAKNGGKHVSIIRSTEFAERLSAREADFERDSLEKEIGGEARRRLDQELLEKWSFKK